MHLPPALGSGCDKARAWSFCFNFCWTITWNCNKHIPQICYLFVKVFITTTETQPEESSHPCSGGSSLLSQTLLETPYRHTHLHGNSKSSQADSEINYYTKDTFDQLMWTSSSQLLRKEVIGHSDCVWNDKELNFTWLMRTLCNFQMQQSWENAKMPRYGNQLRCLPGQLQGWREGQG